MQTWVTTESNVETQVRRNGVGLSVWSVTSLYSEGVSLGGTKHTIRRKNIQLCSSGESCQFRAITTDKGDPSYHLVDRLRRLRVPGSYSRLAACNDGKYIVLKYIPCMDSLLFGFQTVVIFRLEQDGVATNSNIFSPLTKVFSLRT